MFNFPMNLESELRILWGFPSSLSGLLFGHINVMLQQSSLSRHIMKQFWVSPDDKWVSKEGATYQAFWNWSVGESVENDPL